MRYFIDQEFMEDGKTIELISIGIVAEDGRELYEISSDFEEWKCDDWLKVNVLPLLGTQRRISREAIRLSIEQFLIHDDKPEFWGYFSDYDWVCFCRLWGRMLDLPDHFPKFCLDLKQEFYRVGVHKPKNVVVSNGMEHNALADAHWNKRAYEWLDRQRFL